MDVKSFDPRLLDPLPDYAGLVLESTRRLLRHFPMIRFLKIAHIASSRERQPACMRDELEELLLGYVMRCVILAGVEYSRCDDLGSDVMLVQPRMTPYHRPYVGDALTRHSRSGTGSDCYMD